MKIALIGYGKMGKTIEQIALKRGHQIVLRVDVNNSKYIDTGDLRGADVAIEFSQPDSAPENIRKCFKAGVPVVCGTTGWMDQLDSVSKDCKESSGAFFYASNYSIGVNLFFEVNKKLAELMNSQPQYDEVLIHESHHLAKLDSPSGTAISLAEQVIEKMDRVKHWVNYKTDESVTMGAESEGELPIFSTREDEIPGTHIVKYFSDVDEIEIVHKALSRQGFAIGALTAAEWLQGKKGVFTMKDMLSL
ncbi:MAG: 4-hydroxy-tetrahydrodipicolinate reductase [Bacteroidetes bacterium]|nr:4-hydroxy-tetrahydrodipicolinate reductase [Bacteroidota bacterium]